MKRRVLSLAIALALVSPRAHAESRAVLVIGGGASFRDALTVALSAWELRVVPSEGPAPRPIMPRAADEARALAQQANASGVVWIAADLGEPSLWVYDTSSDQLVTRRLGMMPPFDAPTAAAAALSVKTLLRSSTVAPVAERIGAPPQSPAIPARPEPRDVVTPSVPDTSPPLLRAELEGAGRSIADDLDARASVGLSLWLGAHRQLGIALTGGFGPGLSIDAERFAGRFSEIDVSPSVRLRLPLSERFVLEPRLGVSLHATSIDGVAVATSRTAQTSRVDGSVDAAVAFELVATRSLGIAMDGGISWMLRYQRYLVESETVLELHPVQAFFGLRVTTGLL